MDKNFGTYVELTLAMTFLGATVVIGKSLVTEFPIFLLLGIRFLLGSLVFLPIVHAQSGSFSITKHPNNPLNIEEWSNLFLQAFFGALLFNIFMLYGLRFSTATAAGILTSTTPAFTALLSFLLLSEQITKRKIFAVIAAISGVAVINFSGGSVSTLNWHLQGNSLIILAVLSGALLTILIKRIAGRVTAVGMSLMFNIFGFLLFFPFALSEGLNFAFAGHPPLVYMLVVLYSMLGSVAFPILWNRGIAMVPASTASLFTGVMPISTAFLAYAFLGEGITIMQVIGMAFVLFAITLDVAYKQKDKMAEVIVSPNSG
jgi:drug/metabolite transporter (DMT)-like permease